MSLQLDGTDGTPVWLDELVAGELRLVELDDLEVEDLLVLEDLMVEDLEVEDLLVLEDFIVDDLEVDDLLVLEDLIVEDLEVELLEFELEEVLGATVEELTTGVADDTLATRLELDGTTWLELETSADDTTLEETTGVADELDSTLELVEDGTLATAEDELTTLDTGTTETELEESESSSLEELEAKADTDELAKTEDDKTVAELAGVDKLENTNELTTTGDETLELTKLELKAEDIGADDITLELELEVTVGVALNTIFKGLSQGIVKSKLIEKMLYCTRQVRPSPVGTAWALALIAENEDKLSVKTKAEIVK